MTTHFNVFLSKKELAESRSFIDICYTEGLPRSGNRVCELSKARAGLRCRLGISVVLYSTNEYDYIEELDPQEIPTRNASGQPHRKVIDESPVELAQLSLLATSSRQQIFGEIHENNPETL